MDDYDEMDAFRERQKERPPEVPKDIERQNARSVQRNNQENISTVPTGDTGVPDSVRAVVSSSGRSLEPEIRREMEERMDAQFGDVQIHTGPKAASACEDINARAFTVGRHIAFNTGEYVPESSEGQYLLAHELTHTRQQSDQNGIHRMPKNEEIVAKLQEIVSDSDRFPGTDTFESDLEERLDDINNTWLKEKLEENAEFTVEDVEAAIYSAGPETDIPRELAVLLQTDKWEEGTTFDKGAHDWKHIVARHVHPEAPGTWPIEPGTETSQQRTATAFPSDMDEPSIKETLKNAIQSATEDEISVQANGYRTVEYKGSELPSGIGAVKIVYDRSSQIVTAYPLNGTNVEELP
ncbi:eCIS core domain-containing protein [Natrinema altunense]|nr:DUF4157 domain-containing protein [Natrinema altunense]